MDKIVDLKKWPIDRLNTPEGKEFIANCKAELERDGMFNLAGFLHPETIDGIVAGVVPTLKNDSFTHERRHNVYFKKQVEGVDANDPVLTEFETSNCTICADQFADSDVLKLYQWEPFRKFLAAVMEIDTLYPMDDDLACANVMSYRKGQTLNWHFDRSEFTTTLLLQAPEVGGDFLYSTDLRTADNPNYPGVLRLLQGEDDNMQTMKVTAGTLNVFRGKNTPHRVSPVDGKTDRIIAVFSYYQQPGVKFSPEEQIGFYGRSI
ncbi:MAG: hypothetical protein ACI8YI_000921 [Paracoccaceae bacterium]|jgi:hypothetical protein